MLFSLNLFTLNCWGIPVVSKNRKERMEAIGTYLLNSPHDVICLQEIWSEKDFIQLKEKLNDAYPYSHYFYSGVLGSGLCIYSKWVIQDVFFHQWPLNGYIHKIHHGDWFGGKGVGLCRIKCGDKLINIYCTHLHAEYHEDDIYLAHRVLQAYSTAEFVKLTSPSADVAILAGDMNTAPGDLSYRLITEVPGLLDPFHLEHQCTNAAVRKASGTSDTANNSYSNPKMVKVTPEGKRIDHILFNCKDTYEVDILNFGNPLDDRVPGQDFSYSDHNAVCLEIRIRSSDKRNSCTSIYNPTDVNKTIADAIKVCDEAKVVIAKAKTLYLTIGSLIFMLLLGTVGYWPNLVLYDVIKIIMTGICFYYLVMGTLWNQIEMNSIKAGVTALVNKSQDSLDLKTSADTPCEQPAKV